MAEWGYVVGPDEGDSGTEDRRRVVRLNREQTGLVSIITTTIRPGVLVPPHWHEKEDEIWFVRSGVVNVMLEDDLHRVVEGSTVWRPKGFHHTSWVPPDEGNAEVLTVMWPGGWEQQVREFIDSRTADGAFDEPGFVEMARQNGVHWDFDRGRKIAEQYGLRMMGETA